MLRLGGPGMRRPWYRRSVTGRARRSSNRQLCVVQWDQLVESVLDSRDRGGHWLQLAAQFLQGGGTACQLAPNLAKLTLVLHRQAQLVSRSQDIAGNKLRKQWVARNSADVTPEKLSCMLLYTLAPRCRWWFGNDAELIGQPECDKWDFRARIQQSPYDVFPSLTTANLESGCGQNN